MSETTDPKSLGINSWLEDELYQQYLHDRKTVDESWKKVFEPTAPPAAPHWERPAGSPAARPPSPAPAHQASAGELMPLPRRGRPHRREHDGEPLHSPGHLAAQHSGEGDRREPAHHQRAPHAHRQEQDLLHAHHRLGHRQGARDEFPTLNHAYARDAMASLFAPCASRSTSASRWTWRVKMARASLKVPEHQERRRDEL